MMQNRNINTHIRRVAVVNRGEAALRFLRTAEVQTPEIEAVFLYTEAEIHSSVFWAFKAKQRLDGGPSAYQDPGLVLKAARAAECDSAWLGWGFASEKASFVQALEAGGLTVLSPRADTLQKLGDKSNAGIYAAQAGFELLPSITLDFIETFDRSHIEELLSVEHVTTLSVDWKKEAIRIYHEETLPPLPWILKATEGGGGRGIYEWNEDFPSLESWLAWLEGIFVSTVRAQMRPRFILETRLFQPRHIELQLIGDGQGGVDILGARECSVQRRHQKLIEECPPSGIADELLNQAIKCGRALGCLLSYRSVGTIELLFDSHRSRLYFLEVNPRLQVEHPVTELVYGVDLIELQLNIARGDRLDNIFAYQPIARGVAIEARLYAEDPSRDFSPTNGKLVKFRIPSGPGVRIDSGYQEGDQVIGEFDPMLAKVIAYAPNRKAAIKRLQQVLSSSQILIQGGASNHYYLNEVLKEKDFREARWHTQKVLNVTQQDRTRRGIAQLTRAIDIFSANAERQDQVTLHANLISGDQPMRVYRTGPEHFLCCREETFSTKDCKDSMVEYVLVEYQRLNDGAGRLSLLDQTQTSYQVERIEGAQRYWIDGESHDLSQSDQDQIIAPSLGVVLSAYIKVGDHVKRGQTLLKLESMKVEVAILAPRNGIISVIYVDHEKVVQSGELLVSLKPEREKGSLHSSVIMWSTQALPLLPYLEVATRGWDLPPLDLMNQTLYQGVNETEVAQRTFTLTDHFLDLAEVFDRRARQTGQGFIENHALSAQPRRMINAYQRGDRESLPTHWVEVLERCLHRLQTNTLLEMKESTSHLLWRGSRLLRTANQLPTLSSLIADLLRIHEMIPQRLLDRIAILDPERFPHLIEFANERSLKWSKKLSQRRLLKVDFDRWISKEILSHELQPFPESLISQLLKEVYNHHLGALLRLIETLSPQIEVNTDIARHIYLMSSKLTPQFGLISDDIDQPNTFNKEEPWILWLVMKEPHDHIDSSWLKTESIPLLSQDNLARLLGVYVLDLWPQKNEITQLSSAVSLLWRQLTDSDMTKAIDIPTILFNNGLNFTIFHGGRPHQRKDSQYLGIRHLTTDSNDLSLSPVIAEDVLWRDLTPRQITRLAPQRWERFRLERLADCEARVSSLPHSTEMPAVIFKLIGRENSEDIRLFTYAEVYQLNRRRGRPLVLPDVDHAFYRSIKLLYTAQRKGHRRALHWNRLILRIIPPIPLGLGVIKRYMTRLIEAARWVGLEKLVIRARFYDKTSTSGLTPLTDVSIYQFAGREASLVSRLSSYRPLMPRTRYESLVVNARRRGLTHPAEVIHLLEGGGSGMPRGRFTLFDYERSTQRLVPTSIEKIFDGDETLDSSLTVKAASMSQRCGVVIGEIITTINKPKVTLKRLVILSDPTLKMAALGQEECDRVIAALRRAELESLPIEWLTVSSGAKIDWTTGTENLDACAEVLREIIHFTQRGGMINIIVNGPAVGAQSYWNAESTMMNHCCGTLIMTDSGAMVLTGKRALDISGCVSASDDVELGGYTSIMGPNGQAQMRALDVVEAYQTLYLFYRLCYVPSRQKRVPRRGTKDPKTRDIGQSVYPKILGHAFSHINEIFSELNEDRKRPFAIKPVMKALIDQDDAYLDRWSAWEGAETVVVRQCRIFGYATTLIGIENQALQRLSPVQDGPQQWRGGTLYPQASRKLARAINASQSRYPVTILANLSGFDGSPESLRQGQLEYGSEIAQAVHRFDCPIYLVILSRYHGGAYVVFSKRLNPKLETLAIRGSYASVIGGGPAASIIFRREVKEETQKRGGGSEAKRLASQEIASTFDKTHSVERALRVGSIDEILSVDDLREVLANKLQQDYDQIQVEV